MPTPNKPGTAYVSNAEVNLPLDWRVRFKLVLVSLCFWRGTMRITIKDASIFINR